MARSETIRQRVDADEKAELLELATWVGEANLSDLVRRALDELKLTSGFEDRNTDMDALPAGPAVAAFTPGIGLEDGAP